MQLQLHRVSQNRQRPGRRLWEEIMHARGRPRCPAPLRTREVASACRICAAVKELFGRPVAEPHLDCTDPVAPAAPGHGNVRPRNTNWRCAISSCFAAKAISR